MIDAILRMTPIFQKDDLRLIDANFRMMLIFLKDGLMRTKERARTDTIKP